MSSTPDSSNPLPRPSIGRAAFFGLAAGMIFGGAWLLFLGLRGLFSSPDCAGLSQNECDLLAGAATHIGRVQAICGGALIALAPSLYIVLRPYLSPRDSGPKSS